MCQVNLAHGGTPEAIALMHLEKKLCVKKCVLMKFLLDSLKALPQRFNATLRLVNEWHGELKSSVRLVYQIRAKGAECSSYRA